MVNLLTQKLERFAPLSLEDRGLLDDTIGTTRTVSARSDLDREGQASGDVRLILEGFACRYKLLSNGRRQIVGYLLPGDLCHTNTLASRTMDHSIGSLSTCTVVDIPRRRVLELTERPGIAQALWWIGLVEEGTLREWLLNIGQRHSTQRIAHLLCELFTRLQIVGLADAQGYELPLTQTDIGDTVGLSFVHVNRCLQTLRAMELIVMKNKVVVINDLHRMIAFANFNPNYLHLPEREPVMSGTR